MQLCPIQWSYHAAPDTIAIILRILWAQYPRKTISKIFSTALTHCRLICYLVDCYQYHTVSTMDLFNIDTIFPIYRFLYNDKTTVRPSNHYIKNSHTSKMAIIYSNDAFLYHDIRLWAKYYLDTYHSGQHFKQNKVWCSNIVGLCSQMLLRYHDCSPKHTDKKLYFMAPMSFALFWCYNLISW